ncbi:MAG: hypothetical protein VKK04_01985 [Synechococcales bacterium]|nr:hypothetical protein [Synechococcales bacterium]
MTSREPADEITAQITALQQNTSATLDRIARMVEINTEQVGRLSEHIMAIDIKLERLIDTTERNAAAVERNAAAVERNAAAIERNAAAIERLAYSQDHTVARLTQLVETLISRNL